MWQSFLKSSIYIGLAILLCVPFLVTDTLYFPFITGKAYAFRIVTEIIFFLWIILATIDKSYRPKKGPILCSLLIFTGVTFIANYFGIDRPASFMSNFERMEGWITIAHLLGLFMVTSSVIRKKESWYRFLGYSVLMSMLMSLVAFGQINEEGTGYRIVTTLGNSTYVGIYMLMHAFISLLLMGGVVKKIKTVSSETVKLKTFLANPLILALSFSFAVTSFLVFQTATRGSMIGWFLGIGVILLSTFFSQNGKLVFRKWPVIIAVIFIAAASSIFIFKDSSVIQDSKSLNRLTSISLNEGTAKTRILNWQIATEGFKEKPLLGWGQSNFNYVFDKYYPAEHYGNEPIFDRVHNIIFDWLIAAGILGLVSYLLIWFFAIRGALRSDSLSKTEKAVLLAFFGSYFAHNFFVFDQVVSYIYFILMLAFVHSMSFGNVESQNSRKESLTGKETALVALSVLLLVMSVYNLNIKNINLNKTFIESIKITTVNADGTRSFNHEEGPSENFALVKSLIDMESTVRKDVLQRIPVIVSELKQINNLDSAIVNDFMDLMAAETDKEIAKEYSDSVIVHATGVMFAQNGDFENAEKYLLEAIKIAPEKQIIRMTLIKVYILSHKFDQAVALAKETYELDTSHDDLWLEYARAQIAKNPDDFTKIIAQAVEENQLVRAEALLVNSVENNPDNHNVYISLAAFYFQTNQIEKSVIVLDETAKIFPSITENINSLKQQILSGENPTGKSF